MGVKIHYRGRLRDFAQLESLLNDIVDICMGVGWRVMPVHPSNIMPGKGLILMPEGSEFIWLTFLPSGLLYDVSHFIFSTYPEHEKVDHQLGCWISVKTRYAGLDAHIAIIKMFRYLSFRYFAAFELQDDSGYWETNDVSTCAQHFGISEQEYIHALQIPTGDEEESQAVTMDVLILERGGMGINWN